MSKYGDLSTPNRVVDKMRFASAASSSRHLLRDPLTTLLFLG